MKKYLYFGLTVVLSGGLSAATTYFVTKKYFEAKTQAEIEEIREIYREKERELNQKSEFIIPKVEQQEKKEKKDSSDQSEWGQIKLSLRRDYEKYAKKYIRQSDDKPELEELARDRLGEEEFPHEEDDETDLQEEYGVERVYTGEDENGEPYTISFETFTDDESFEKVELWYYADNVVAEEHPTEGLSMVSDAESILGYKNLECLKGVDPDDETYIRCPRFGRDYIVYREDDTFAEAILGVTDTEVFKKNERRRKFDDDD